MTAPFKQKLSYAVIGLLFILILIVPGYYFINRRLSEPIEIKDVTINTKAAFKLNILKQISKKNGIKKWELEATSATLLKNENKAVLKDVCVTFFTRDNKQICLISKAGLLDTKQHDMVFSQDVVVTYETFVIRTDQLQYKKKEHIIYSQTHVVLEKGGSTIEADAMATDLNRNTTIFEGNVKGKFREDFSIK